MNLYSYVVAYDSGFAPNPYYHSCTLATCKPNIRKHAQIGDWIIGCGSADKQKFQQGKLVYAMKISEIKTLEEYFSDQRFLSKKPILNGSRKQARGDNIYYKNSDNSWGQLNSYHSQPTGQPELRHVQRDTRVNRMLISNHFRYFGKDGPDLPSLVNEKNKSLCHGGRGCSKFTTEKSEDTQLMKKFIEWFNSLGELGYQGHPYDWDDEQ